MNETAVLEWVNSDETREIEGEIENVSRKMLEKMLETKDYVAVLFCTY